MKLLISYSLLFFSLTIFAQEKDKDLPKGNVEYNAKKYAEAEAEYRISGSKNPKKSAAKYNLGNAIYRQNQSAEAKLYYEKAIKASKTRPEKHQAFHNLGNVYMNEKNYGAAVEAYKNALRNNPIDDETRYNYALAKQMLKDNPPKDDKKDDKKDKKKKKTTKKTTKKIRRTIRRTTKKTRIKTKKTRRMIKKIRIKIKNKIQTRKMTKENHNQNQVEFPQKESRI